MIKYILWDLDGTVVESEDVIFKTSMLKYASTKHGLIFDFAPGEFIGQEGKNIYRTLLKRNNIIEEDESAYWDSYNNWYESAVSFIKENITQIKPRENIIELWDAIRETGIKNVIVTNSREDVAHAYLKNIGLYEQCSLFICINHVVNPKPDAEPYLMAMNKLQTSPGDCIAIEDSFLGIKSAKAAALYTIAWVKNINNPDYAIADKITDILSIDIITKSRH